MMKKITKSNILILPNIFLQRQNCTLKIFDGFTWANHSKVKYIGIWSEILLAFSMVEKLS
jgi:hypothetical protein